MLRRDFLAGSGSLILVGLDPPRLAFGQTKYVPAKIIDVHMTISKQIALMSRLSRERPAELPHIHGFVPFDPLRQAIYDKIGGPVADSPLAIVEKAIMQQGFIGVKLYPPMGFRATDNANAGNDFPCWVRFGKGSPGYDEACSERGHGNDGLGNEPGALLDAVLMKLYEWCAANNVPIMAHTNNSNAAGPGYGTRANPKYWQLVLQKFPSLHVNFAHFGGFHEAFSDGRLDPAALNNTWERTIGRMVSTAPDRPIFADLSYFSEVLDQHSQQRKDALTCSAASAKPFRIARGFSCMEPIGRCSVMKTNSSRGLSLCRI